MHCHNELDNFYSQNSILFPLLIFISEYLGLVNFSVQRGSYLSCGVYGRSLDKPKGGVLY